MMQTGMLLFGVSRRDPRVVGLYSRHYSSKKNRKTIRDWLDYGVTAPGETISLMSADSSVLFVWLKQKYVENDQVGVNCAVFRNEGSILASDIILEAESFAWGGGPENDCTHTLTRMKFNLPTLVIVSKKRDGNWFGPQTVHHLQPKADC